MKEVEIIARRSGYNQWIGVLMIDGKEEYRTGAYTITPELAMIKTVEWARDHRYDV
jgi:hypothetical protein